MITVNVSDKLLLHSCKSPPQQTRECSTCHHLHKMREQLLICLLLAWLLLAVSQLQGSQINVQAIESVRFKFRSRSPMPRPRLPNWVEMKKIHKSPSGPNPVGNHHPPSRH
ncbi:hypothetical protein ERO13_A05G096800v2 [Gossypium hirsutum]|nr:hypothetical protein ERO13_A05G096800v2 [Gossypium hirsutum]